MKFVFLLFLSLIYSCTNSRQPTPSSSPSPRPTGYGAYDRSNSAYNNRGLGSTGGFDSTRSWDSTDPDYSSRYLNRNNNLNSGFDYPNNSFGGGTSSFGGGTSGIGNLLGGLGNGSRNNSFTYPNNNGIGGGGSFNNTNPSNPSNPFSRPNNNNPSNPSNPNTNPSNPSNPRPADPKTTHVTFTMEGDGRVKATFNNEIKSKVSEVEYRYTQLTDAKSTDDIQGKILIPWKPIVQMRLKIMNTPKTITCSMEKQTMYVRDLGQSGELVCLQ